MIQPGTLLQNRYRVAEQIGKGGMGEVYAATDERFQSKVAIKRTFFDDAEMSRAFKREARLLNHLRHPALPKVTDHFEEAGGQFIVMEFMEGSDLAELMKRRKVPFPLTDVLRWADQLLDALEYLHAQTPAVVHRDIKPPNIKLTPNGQIVLLDFGLAKGAPPQTASGPASSVHGFSHNFAPLEQMEGSGTGPRSDLYSLAATLYYLLTGLRPPDAVTRAVAAIKDQSDPLRHAHLVQPQVPAAVGQILHRAMSQNSELRHASARELREALRLAASNAAPAKVLAQKAQPPLAAEPDRAGQHTAQDPTLSSSLSRKLHPAGGTASKNSRRTSPAHVSETAATRVDARPARPKLVFACLLLVCAAAGAYLLARPSETTAPAAAQAAQVQNPAPQQTATAQDAVPSRQTTVQDSSANPSTEREWSEKSEPDARPVAEASVASESAGPNSTDGGATTAGPNGSTVTPAGRPALVIQNPAPATNPADEARRRAEESGREQSASPPPHADRPPPGAPYPPPPWDRRPPPPDGRRPPPPRFRP